MSPFAANISLKKTPVKTKSGIPLLPYVPNHSHSSVDVEALVTKNLELENELLKMKNTYADAIDDSETARKFMNQIEIKKDPNINQELQNSKILVNKLNDKVTILVKEKKQLESTLENKNEDIRNLKMSDKAKNGACVKLNKELKDLKLKFNKEKSDIVKSHKQEVKCLQKELGEEISHLNLRKNLRLWKLTISLNLLHQRRNCQKIYK